MEERGGEGGRGGEERGRRGGGEGEERGGGGRGGGDLPTHSLQEFSGKEMVADVSSREGKAAVLVPFLCRLDANLTVLHHLVVWE